MKILGMVFIFAVPVLIGFSMSEGAKAGLQRLEGLIELIAHIKYEISFFQTKQEEILKKFSNAALGDCGFLNKLKSAPFSGEYSMLYYALTDGEELLGLDGAEMKILTDFSESFGHLAIGEQTEKCENCIKALEQIYNSKKSDVASKVKLYRTIGFVSGLGIVLTII